MAERLPIFRVTISAHGVAVDRIDPGHSGYRKASKTMILRQRDAIEHFRNLKTAGKGYDGVHCFQFLDSARTFAMLRLQAMEHDVQKNLDRVLAFDQAEKAKRH